MTWGVHETETAIDSFFANDEDFMQYLSKSCTDRTGSIRFYDGYRVIYGVFGTQSKVVECAGITGDIEQEEDVDELDRLVNNGLKAAANILKPIDRRTLDSVEPYAYDRASNIARDKPILIAGVAIRQVYQESALVPLLAVNKSLARNNDYEHDGIFFREYLAESSKEAVIQSLGRPSVEHADYVSTILGSLLLRDEIDLKDYIEN